MACGKKVLYLVVLAYSVMKCLPEGTSWNRLCPGYDESAVMFPAWFLEDRLAEVQYGDVMWKKIMILFSRVKLEVTSSL